MSVMRRPSAIAAALLAAAVVTSCDTPTVPPTEGSLAPRIALIQPDAETRASLVLPLTAVRATVIGPTGKVIDLTLQGTTWQGKAKGLQAGTYDLVVEGLAGGEVQFYGRTTGITVARGAEASPAVPFAAAVPVVSAPPLANSTNFSQRIPFARIAAATGYSVQVSQSPTFASGNIEFATADTNPLVTVTDIGTWYVRTRATLPNTSSPVPWSDSRSWQVNVATGGDNAGAATPVAVTPGSAETVAQRNLTPTKREDWFDVAVRAGDSIFVETFAQRLNPASPLNTIVTLFRSNGTTVVATNDDHAATTDSRIVAIAPGTETAKVRVSAASNTSGHFEASLEIRRLPAAPTALTRTVVSGTRVDLEWTDNSDNETQFAIERCAGVGCTTFVEVGTVAADVDTYSDAALTANTTYRWRVRARNAFGTSGYTAIVTASTAGPNAPTALDVTTVSETQIDLSWTDNADNELQYIVERCAGVGCSSFTQLAALDSNTTAYSDLTVVFGQSYTYRVRATNAVTTSAFSNEDTADTFPPGAPSALSATVMGATRIDLAWTDNASNEIGFRIERCTGDACSNFAEIATVGADVTAYQDLSVAFNTGYRYRVRAYHVITGITYTNTANADTRPPATPSDLVATTVSGASISLTWTDNADDETSYEVQRCTNAGCVDFGTISTEPAGTTAYVDNGVSVGNEYRYRVIAVGVPGNSAASNIAEPNTLLPADPSGATATTVSGTRIDISWTDNSDNETSFQIFSCEGAGCSSFTLLATVGADITTHQDSTVQSGEQHSYRVRALNVSGASGFTSTVLANTLPPADPSALSATVVSGSRIDLAWTINAPEATGTRIERCAGVSCSDFAEITFVPAPTTTFQDIGGADPVAINNTYTYRVRSQNAADVSGYSNASTATTLEAAAPVTFTATMVAGPGIQLDWSASTGPGAPGYEIQRCTGMACSDFALLTGYGAGTLQHVDTDVTPGMDYRYRVRAVNIVGPGPFSGIASSNTRLPIAPSSLAATVMPGLVRLTWQDNADNERSVVVMRCAGAACVLADHDTISTADVTTWDDSTVVATTEYTYRVRAENVLGASGPSVDAFANTVIADPVTVLAATAVSPTQIDLAWTPSASQGSGLITNYNVYRCDGVCDPSSVGVVIAALPADSAAYADTPVEPDSAYTYLIRPQTAFGDTPFAGSATAFASTALPAAPSALVATLLSPTSIQLDWTDNSDDETEFQLAQCAGVGCTNFVQVASTGVDVATFLADTLTFDVRYRFIVRAVNTAGASAWSDTLETGTTVPAVPTDLAAFITDGGGNIRLVWSDASDDESGFEIDYCAGAGCVSWIALSTPPANSTQYDVGGGGAATYRFRVRAVNAAGSSANSDFAEITGDAPYAAPTGMLATTTGPTSILVTWTDQTNNETTFGIYRCTGGGCDPLAGALIDSVPRDSTAFTDTSVPTGALYRYAVVATNGFATLASAAFDGHTMFPDAAGTLSATALSSTEIALAWSDGGPFETGYVVERCDGVGCVNFAAIDTVPANFVSYNDAGLTPNLTYRYRVRAINAVGGSAYSNVAEKTTDLPATPTDLSALAMSGTRIDLAWTDNATNEDNYIVERCAGTCDANGTYTEIETGVAPDAEAYSDVTVSAGQTYSYRVRALNSGGVSPYTNIASATTAAPITPTDLVVTTLSGSLIDLTWTDNATNELVFQVERCASADCPTFTLRQTLPADATGYVDTVAVDDAYTYRVRAVNNVGASGYTSEETANTFLPASATDFTVGTVSGTRIDLSWTDNATNEDGYVLERCSGVGCSDFVLLDTLPADVAGYQNDGIAAQTSFTYRLYAYNIAGQSGLAGPGTATTITPAAPTALSSVLAAPGQIDLTWTDNADNELQYRVERCSAGTSKCATADSMDVYAVEVATLGPDAASHSDPGLAPATLYFYRVRATNIAGASAYTAIVSRSTSVPPAPSGLAALTILGTRIDLSWTDASANEEGFSVERCIGADPCLSFVQIAVLPAGTASHEDSTLSAGQEVHYRVLAFNGGGGNASNVASATTIVPAAPSSLAAVAFGMLRINLTWNDNAGDEAGFYVERCEGLDCVNFVPIDTLAIDVASYGDSSVSAGGVYGYRVRAFGNGHSEYSAVAAAATIAPNPPTDLVATAISDTRIDLTWTDNTPSDSLWNETVFFISRCEGDSCTPTAYSFVGSDETSFVDTLLTPGVSYSYQVEANNPAAYSGLSNIATAATTVPAVPTALSDSTISTTEVLLSWTDNAGNETGYEIERCEGSACTDFAPVDSAAADAQSAIVGGLVGGTFYRFRIRAFNASGSSGYSNIVVTQSDVPAAPTALVGATVSPTQVTLAWDDNASNETAYIVERCDGTGCVSFAVIDSLPADVTSYPDATIAIDTIYVYRVRASNAVGPSAYTAEVAVSTYRPQTPTALAATPISATRVDLTWTDVAANDTVIVVERCLGFGCSAFADIASLAADATAFSDTTVTVNNTYNYRLRAENAAGASAPTDSVEVGTFIPSDPSGLTANTNSPTQIMLNWVDNSTTEIDFLIERCVGVGCSAFDSLFVVAADEVTYADTAATLGNSYTYRVIARGGGGNSGPSNGATAHTFPAADLTSLTGTPLTATTLQLAWSAAEFATLYQIDTVSGGDTTFVAFVSAGLTDTVVTVPTGQSYEFLVRASNAAGSGAPASAIVVMTPPPVPGILTVFPLSTSQASLAWNDTSSRETGFEVERAFFNTGAFGAYATVATLGANVTSTVNGVVVPTGRYKYRVRAVNQIGAGAYTNEVDLTLSGPVAPSGLAAVVSAPGKITLTWTDNSDSEQGFSIERSIGDNLSFAQVAVVGAGVQAHVDSSGLAINTSYYYRVRAVNNIGASAYTNEASTTTTVPSAVAAIGSSIQSSTSIQVGWNGAGTVGETGFRVYRCVGVGCTDFTLLDGSLPADASTYTDVTAAYGVHFRYQVRPYNIAGEPVGNLTADRFVVLPTPSILALPVDRTSMRVQWNANIFTWETGYEVEECVGFGCTGFAPIATVAADDSVAVSGGLAPNGIWHRYRVRAVAEGNAGPWSSAATSNTPREISVGDTLVTATGEEVSATQNMTHYVVAMLPGSPTVEVSIGDDPNGTTVTGGSYLVVSRGKGITRHVGSGGLYNIGQSGDTLCSVASPPAPNPFVQSGQRGGCALPHLGVTTDYYITTYSNPYSNLQLTALPGPTLYAFNSCTQTGNTGPTQGQCDAAYASTSLEGQVAIATPGLQDWSVPFSGRWAVVAVGAAGASATPGFSGGRGARVIGEFVLTAGQSLRLAVGQMGSGDGSGTNGGGGGGSFVYDITGSTPLVIAGGGGGTRGGAIQNGCDASTTAFGIVGSASSSSSPCTVKASGAGEGGVVSAGSWGSAGAGFNSNGGSDATYGVGGSSWASFLLGGLDTGGCGAGLGGFGGGGSGGGCNGGGGGGGYSGGDGGWIAGGGGSFNAGTNGFATPGIGTANGTIILRYLGPVD